MLDRRLRGFLAVALAVLAGAGADGALALRTASPAERRAMLPILTAESGDRGACRGLGHILRVSTVNGRYLRASYANRVRYRLGCSVGDGYSIYYRGRAGRWRRLSSYGWVVAPCRVFGVRLALDLTRDAGLRCG